ncbi:MAG TPA: UDP-N-acetylglucosamine 1-carboxyvinyltransferase [Candidatus Saccharimonadia bacterium]|nr:UDP-N-acetylglucosamine 1-carboxyvinyltransferase [Candidatus Saccharimonadia bacterium]
MAKTLHIRGGKPLSGRIRVAGAKNAASKMMIASLLTSEEVILDNCPQIEEISITSEICEAAGANVRRQGGRTTVHAAHITSSKVTGLSRANRISVLALAPLLHRIGEAEVPLVGGDKIGPRPVNFHLDALQLMGATIEETATGYLARAPKEGLHGATITLAYPSVGATESVIFAGALATGRTRIENAAVEPEIVDIVMLLQQMGAIIEFGANRTITIDGVAALHGAHYSILPDRLEAASFACLAIATGGEIIVDGARQSEMVTFLNTVRRIGAEFEVSTDGIRFRRSARQLTGIEFETDTYPGFATDWQQPLVVTLTQANGISVVHETVSEDRFGYTEDLRRMGADIGVFAKCLGELPCRYRNRSLRHSAVIEGPTPLTGTEIEIPDIRAGMAQVIAALVADGESVLTGVHHLERGYEGLWNKLRAVGADFDLR